MIWKDKALKHAKDQFPNESVGLVLNVKGKYRYYPCNNLATSPQQTFILDPKDYVKAESQGQIMYIVHSHPITDPTPTQADLIGCEDSGKKWYIVNPTTEQWSEFEPTGYQANLLGRPYIYGITDCWSLVRDWYKQEKNIILRDYKRPTTPEDFLKDPLFESLAWRTGFRELRKDEQLKYGDVLLMSILHPTLNHVAIFLGDMVLHHLADRLSCKEPYSEWLLKCTGKRYRYVENN